jgi:methylglutaconyl-CoA hydratase
VHRVTAPERLDQAVQEIVGDLLQAGPAALGEIKTLFAQLQVGPVTPQVRELTAATIARVRGTDEAKEGFAAFLGKRPPSWIPQ